MKRVMIIGNGGGGKDRPGWALTPVDVVANQRDDIQGADRWIIDGFGPWDTIERRAELSDTIIFVDHPIWVHF